MPFDQLRESCFANATIANVNIGTNATKMQTRERFSHGSSEPICLNVEPTFVFVFGAARQVVNAI